MQNNLPGFKRFAQRRKIDIGQWIDNVIAARHADLEQAKFFAIGMETVCFRIDGNAVDRLELLKEIE